MKHPYSRKVKSIRVINKRAKVKGHKSMGIVTAVKYVRGTSVLIREAKGHEWVVPEGMLTYLKDRT